MRNIRSRMLATAMLLAVLGFPVPAQSVPDAGESLLHMGPHPIGFRAETVVDPSSGRPAHLMIWYPTSDDVAGKPVATYQQVIPRVGSSSLLVLPFTITADDFSSFVEHRLVYQDVTIATGPHPLVVHLPATGTPGFSHIYEGVKFASHGFIFVSVTQALGDACQLGGDARHVLERLLAWNQTAESPFHGAIDPASIYGGGHAFGGRTWIAGTSTQPECGRPPDHRLQGLVLKEATREALTLEQMELNVTPTFLNSQFQRTVQIELQQDLGSRPTALTLEGLTPAPSAQNHALFAQICMLYFANRIAGHPIDSFIPTPIAARCQEPTFLELERFFAEQTTKYNIAFLQTVRRQDAYNAVLAPGHTTPGVHVVKWRAPGS